MIRNLLSEVQKLVLEYAILVGACAALILLIAHSAWSEEIRVDGVSVGLVAVIVLIPYLRLVRRVRFADFEAEIGTDEVRNLAAEVGGSQPDKDMPVYQPKAAHSDLFELVERDPQLALAKLRLQLESALSKAARFYDYGGRRETVASLTRFLRQEELLDEETSSQIAELTSILNRAVHGAEIGTEEASQVLRVGESLLRTVEALGVMEPESRVVIDKAEIESYQQAEYSVTTIVPYVDKPIRNSYRMTQEQLDSFLEGYNEYAEFLVRVEPASS
jgi:hypothetical protein